MEANITVFPLKWFEVKLTKRYKKQFNKKALNVLVKNSVSNKNDYDKRYVLLIFN